MVLSWPVQRMAIINESPSTLLLNLKVASAIKGPDKLDYVYLGDELHVTYTVVRLPTNYACTEPVWRYAEDVDGPTPGKRHLLDYFELHFQPGKAGDVLYPQWPQPPRIYKWGVEVNEQIKPQNDKPIMPDGVDELTLDIYNVAQYYCNWLDNIIPRYLQGGEKPNETARARVVLKRFKP